MCIVNGNSNVLCNLIVICFCRCLMTYKNMHALNKLICILLKPSRMDGYGYGSRSHKNLPKNKQSIRSARRVYVDKTKAIVCVVSSFSIQFNVSFVTCTHFNNSRWTNAIKLIRYRFFSKKKKKMFHLYALLSGSCLLLFFTVDFRKCKSQFIINNINEKKKKNIRALTLNHSNIFGMCAVFIRMSLFLISNSLTQIRLWREYLILKDL